MKVNEFYWYKPYPWLKDIFIIKILGFSGHLNEYLKFSYNNSPTLIQYGPSYKIVRQCTEEELNERNI